MTDAEKWGLILGTIVVLALVIFVISVISLLRQRRSERVRNAIGTVDEFSQAVNRVGRMAVNDPNRVTAQRVLDAARHEMDEMVPPPQPAGPNLDHWN